MGHRHGQIIGAALLAGGLTWQVSLAAERFGEVPDTAYVRSVYDGDTLTLETGDKVRVRWVNTPEIRPYEPLAQEAKELTERFTRRQQVQVLVGPDPRDGYGRVVAGIRTADGRDLSLALVEAGLGHVFLIPPEAGDPTPLLLAQSRARTAKRGIWGTEAYAGALHMTSFHANGPGDDHQFVNGEYMRIANIASGETSTEGWMLRNRGGQTFPLPAVTIPMGHTVIVRSGRGTTQADVSKQLVIHLGSDVPAWNDDYEVAELISPEGVVVDSRAQGKPR